MIPCHPIAYRALIFGLGVFLIVVIGAMAALADSSTGILLAPQGEGVSGIEAGSILTAARPDQDNPRPPWADTTIAATDLTSAESESVSAAVRLTSATIIRPLKDKKFALALVVGATLQGPYDTHDAGPSIFKGSPSIFATASQDEAIQWVVVPGLKLTREESDANSAVKSGNPETANDEATLRYAVEMAFVPMASLAMRAALFGDREAEAFDSGDLSRSLEYSRIGVSIGLDFRPKEGVMLDIDFARVMHGGESRQLSGAPSAFEPTETNRGFDAGDIVSANLSIQF